MQTFTLEEAAALIANKYGWHEGAQKTLQEQLLDAAKDGTLTVRHPHTDLPYRPKQYREFYERVSASDLNRYFEGVGVPWRLYNDGETGDPIFDTEWWNLMQVLAWVFLGDRSVVRNAALPANERGHFFEEHIMPDGRRELVKRPVGRFTAVSLSVQQADHGSACYPALPMAENAIIEALKEGKLTAYGLQNGAGDLKEIPALSWADLKFWYEPDFAGPKDIFRHGATHWHTLRFKRKAVLAIWSDPLDQPRDRSFAEEHPAGPAAVGAANPFAAMGGLTWTEITITFIETESVRVRARGKSETFTYDAMGFRHRSSHMAKPNECWKTFMHLAIVSTLDKTWDDVSRTSNLKRRISRLRDQLQRFFGIADDPIVFSKSAGYKPAFSLTAEEHAIQNMRERYTDPAGEDEDDDIQQVMSSNR